MKRTIDKRLLDDPWVLGIALAVTLLMLGSQILRLTSDRTLPPIAMPAPLPPGIRSTPLAGAENWVTSEDYPVEAIRAEQEGTTHFRLGVDKEGLPRVCEIVESSGHRSLDDAACSAMMRSARFAPFHGDDGRPRAFSFTKRIVWRIPDAPPAP